jgi:hypothetical protein
VNQTKSNRPKPQQPDWREKDSKLDETAKPGLSILPPDGSAIIDAEDIIPKTDPLVLEFLMSSGERRRLLITISHQLVPEDTQMVKHRFPNKLLHLGRIPSLMSENNGIMPDPKDPDHYSPYQRPHIL